MNHQYAICVIRITGIVTTTRLAAARTRAVSSRTRWIGRLAAIVLAVLLCRPAWSQCQGDLDSNGQVDTSDLLTLLGQWGSPDSGDLDGDGEVSVSDLLTLLGAWGACPPPLHVHVVFDGAVQGDADVVFSRDQATVSRDGEPVAPDTPRFERPQLICGFGDYTEHIGASSGRNTILGSGIHHDGTELMVFQQGTSLRVYTDPTNLATFTTHDMSTASDAETDLMQGTVPDKAYEVRTGCVGRMGLYLAGAVMVNDGGWEYRGAFFAYSAGGKGDGDWVILDEDTDDRDADGVVRPLTPWAMNNVWPLSDLEEWCFLTDYRTDSARIRGGRGWAIRITRPDTASTGVPLGMHLVFDEEDPYVKHTHGGGIIHGQDGSSKAFIVWGDGVDQNHIQTRTIQDRTGYLDDASWEDVEVWHGTSDPTTGEFGFQGIGPCPGASPDTIFMGNDEASTGLMKFTLDSPPTFTTLFGYQWGWKPYVDRTIEFISLWQSRHPTTGQYVAAIRPSENAEHPNDVYLLYSPDGDDWGICARVAPGTGVSKLSAGIFGGNLYWSRLKGTDQTLMSVPIPTTRTVAPLLVGEGVENILDVSGYTANGANVLRAATGGEVAALPPVPCNGPVLRCQAVRGETPSVGELQLAASMADTGFNLKLWYYQVPSARGTAYRLNLLDGGTELRSMSLPPLFASGEWIPLMVGHAAPVNGGAPFTPTLQFVTTANGNQSQWDTYFALETMSDGVKPNGYPVVEATASPPDESCDINIPATPAKARTFYLAWQVPYDQQSSYGLYTASQAIGSLVHDTTDDFIEFRMLENELRIAIRGGGAAEDVTIIAGTRWVPQGVVAAAVVVEPTRTRLFAADHGDGVSAAIAEIGVGMPIVIRAGDRDGAAVVPMSWLGVEVVDGDPGDAAIVERLKTFDWLDLDGERQRPIRPAG